MAESLDAQISDALRQPLPFGLYNGGATTGVLTAFLTLAVVCVAAASVLPRHAQRLRTGAFWIPFVSSLVLYSRTGWALFTLFCSVRGLHELENCFAPLLHAPRNREGVTFFSRVFTVASAAVSMASSTGDPAVLHAVTFFSFVGTFFATVWKFSFQSAQPDFHALQNCALYVFGVVYVSWTLNHVNLIRAFPYGRGMVLCILWLSWFGDAGAYFVGRRLGKHKVSEHLSPGKSWEGVGAEMVTTVALALLLHRAAGAGYMGLDLPPLGLLGYLLFGVVVAVFGMCGDFAASFCKRVAGLKDSSNFFPGHGGILDRFDTFYFVAPTMYVLILTGMFPCFFELAA